MKKLLLTTLIAAFSLLTLNACSTIHGAGEDIQGAGQVISKEAKRAQR